MPDLGTLGGTTDESRAFGMNDLGNVVGYSRITSGGIRAFFWDGETLLDLGVPTGGWSTQAYSINNANQIVGTMGVTGTGEYAAIWDSGRGWRLLDHLVDDPGWQLQVAWGINDSGAIAGRGVLNDQLRAFLAVPVPEPAAALLLASGAGLSALLFRRKNQRFSRVRKGVSDVTGRPLCLSSRSIAEKVQV